MHSEQGKSSLGTGCRAWIPPTILALAILCAFFPVLGANFINYDDQEYVTANAAVAGGMSVDALKWAFTALHSNNWHPLTWVSHLIDIQLYGFNPVGHHLTNLMLHIGNALLVAMLFLRLTGSRVTSWIMAALFALHPLRVESVAWVAERKDLLCGFFWLLAILLYFRYVRRRTAGRYLAMAAAVICSLLAKPMAVTLPLVLLLLDLWPLARFAPNTLTSARNPTWPVLLEKLPLFACSLAVSLITLQAQAHAITAMEPATRLQNALCSYILYMGKHLAPLSLAPFYPYQSCGWPMTVAAGVMLLLITAVCVAARQKMPRLLVGWAWFVVTLVPVIGIVQVGNQAYADRYTYLPGIGLLIMISGIAGTSPAQSMKKALAAAALCVLTLLASVTFVQAGYWHDSITLFRHAVAVTEGNYLAHYNLGSALLKEGQLAEAEWELENSLRIQPDFCLAWSNLGVVYGLTGKLAEAAAASERAVVCDPMNVDAHYNLGVASIELGEEERARHEYQVLCNLDPGAAERLRLRMR